MNADLTPTPEQIAIHNKFLECVRNHPGITAGEIADEIQAPERFVLQACAYLLGAGMLTVDFSDGRYFIVEAPKLPDITPPTEPGLDGFEFFYGLIKQQHGMTREQFAALPEQSQTTIKDATQAFEIMAWSQSSDAVEYLGSPEAFRALETWLNERRAPITQRNLTRAFKAEKKYLDKMKQDHDKDKWQH